MTFQTLIFQMIKKKYKAKIKLDKNFKIPFKRIQLQKVIQKIKMNKNNQILRQTISKNKFHKIRFY